VKALDVLISTAAIVCRYFPHVRFIVAGAVQDTPYMEQLAEQARGLNVQQNVVFLGRRPDVSSLLKMSNLFYLPSRSEGLSNALLEAMACGLPCVAADVGGNRELVHDSGNGYLVPPDDPALAADRILTLLLDPLRARQMGQSGRRIAESGFSVGAMVDRLTECYDGLLVGAGLAPIPAHKAESCELPPASRGRN
jgi:glycosyltransferase involved in cell wall biosynthesis